MKKIALIAVLAAVAFGGCRKKDKRYSFVETISRPTITFTGSRFFSIPVGGSLPAVAATAYDSTLHESADVSLTGTDALDNTTPGLYIVQARAQNRFGFYSEAAVYIAVTDIPTEADLSGVYMRTSNGALVNITELANGLYSTDNVGGAPSLPVVAYFVQIDESTIDLPSQPTDLVGTLDCTGETLVQNPGDTSISWVVRNGYFGTAVRTFVKQ